MSNKKQAPTPRPTPASVWLSAVAMVMSHQASWGQTPAELVNQIGVPGSIPMTKEQLKQREMAAVQKAEQAMQEKQAAELKKHQDEIARLKRELEHTNRQQSQSQDQNQQVLQLQEKLRKAQQAEQTSRERQAVELKKLQDEVVRLKREQETASRQQSQSQNQQQQRQVEQLQQRLRNAQEQQAQKDEELKKLQAQVNQLQQAAQPPQPVTAPAPAPTPAQSPVPPPPPPPLAIADFTKLPSVSGGPDFIVLPLGEFEMGATDGPSPVHRVKVRQRIAMSEKEITTAQYMACVNTGGCKQPTWNEAGSSYNLKTGGSNKFYAGFVGEKQPIVGVSWVNAVEYARWLSAQTGHKYRLATEAEWEYGCRAGGRHTYCGGDDVNAVAWYDENSNGKSQEVGKKKPNAWGLYDMSGNVWEWVADCYNSNEYERRKQREPWLADEKSEEKAGCLRVLRGGSWFNYPLDVRSAYRGNYTPDGRYSSSGFRLARTLP